MAFYRNKHLPAHLICIALYCLIFFHFTWPLLLHFDTTIISGCNDAHVFLWNIDTFTELVKNGQNPFYTDRVCHPVGTWLIMHTYAPVTGLANLIINNPALTLNLITFLNFIVSAVGGMVLFRSFAPNWPLAFIAGFTFAFCPFKATHLLAGHYNLIMTAPIPFYVLALKKLFGSAAFAKQTVHLDLKYLPVCIGLLLIEFTSDYYLTYYLLLFTVASGAFYFLKIDAWSFRTLITTASVAIGAGFIAVGLLEIAGARQHGLYTSADLISYFVPSAFSRWFGTPFAEQIRSEIIKAGPYENITEVGLAPLLLFVLFVTAVRFRNGISGSRELLFLIAFFFIIATPVVNIAGNPVAVLPSAILHYIPFVNNFRVAARATIMIMLFLPIAALLYIHYRYFMTHRYGIAYTVSAIVFASLYAQYLPARFPLLSTVKVPDVYRALASSGRQTVLELPFGIESGRTVSLGSVNTLQMVYQTVHHHNVLGGYLSRLPAKMPDFYQQYPFATMLLNLMRTEQRNAPPPAPFEVEQFLHDFNIGEVVLYPDYNRSAAGEYALAAFGDYFTDSLIIDGYTLLRMKNIASPGNRVTSITKETIKKSAPSETKKRIAISTLFKSNPTRLRKGPMQELQNVRTAIERAHYWGADTGAPPAPELYYSAKALFDSALSAIAEQHEMLPFFRDFTGSKALLDSAEIKAKKAEVAANKMVLKH